MIAYTLKRSKRARHLRLSVKAGGTVLLSAPLHFPLDEIERFVVLHQSWIDRGVRKMQAFKTLPVSGRCDYLKHKEAARAFITERVEYWNRICGYTYGRIAIKDTKRLWGSCSRKGNLNFSYALMFLPCEVADYVVVHELCHIQEPNHSQAFWTLVARVIPEYRRLRKELRTYVRPE